jgi:hypothetical protein
MCCSIHKGTICLGVIVEEMTPQTEPWNKKGIEFNWISEFYVVIIRIGYRKEIMALGRLIWWRKKKHKKFSGICSSCNAQNNCFTKFDVGAIRNEYTAKLENLLKWALKEETKWKANWSPQNSQEEIKNSVEITVESRDAEFRAQSSGRN